MTVDKFGREITDNGDGTYSVTGVTVGASSIDAAVAALNGMAPEEWTEPATPEPLNPVGALATLLVVVGTLEVQDAANAVGLTPDDLIAEAQAWAVASGSLS